MGIAVELRLGEHTPTVAHRLELWDDQDVATRLWDRDHSIWSEEPVAELTDRLGWLGLPAAMTGKIEDLDRFGRTIAAEGFSHAVVLGMGGSSLAPELFQATFGNAPGYPRLLVLDSTHPAAVLSVADSVELGSTLFIVSSKSGSTLETLSFFRYFWARVSELRGDPGRQFVAVTDPGSFLERLATERGFRRIFSAPPDVGGRYSALTEFGLVPAAAIGVNLEALAAGAANAAEASAGDSPAHSNPGLQLGAAMGELALAGADKVTLITSPELDAVPAWIEQLIAESTGKEGRGIVPIGGEETAAATMYSVDRFFVGLDTAGDPVIDALEELAKFGHPVAHLRLDSTDDLGGAMFLLEVAVAVSGAVLGIHPFNQPDVQLAKDLAKRAMVGDLDHGEIIEIPPGDPDLGGHIDSWLGSVSAGDYVGFQAFIQPTPKTREALRGAQHAVRERWKVATTLDFGPRFLHSTGQLHKGGPNKGMFLQLIDSPAPRVAVPETDYDFGSVITAQALGDYQALRQRNRRLLRVSLGEAPVDALAAVVSAIEEAAR